MSTEPVKPSLNNDLDMAMNSLFQQCTVLALGLGAVMKEISGSNPDSAQRIHDSLFVDLFPRLMEKIPDERAQGLMDLLKTAITEGRK